MRDPNTELTQKVRNGEMNGEIVWICHYNRPDLNKKPLRNVPPTQCIVVSNDELPKNKIVYYSESHYRALNKDGGPSSKIISPVDNTGYRTLSGNMLYTFRNKDECIEAWKNQLMKTLYAFEDHIEQVTQSIREEQEALKKLYRETAK